MFLNKTFISFIFSDAANEFIIFRRKSSLSFSLQYLFACLTLFFFARFSACSYVSATMWFFWTVSFAVYFSVYNRTAETHVYLHVYEGFCGEFWNLGKQLLNFIRETFACVNIFLNHFLFIYCLFIYCIFICYVKLVVVFNWFFFYYSYLLVSCASISAFTSASIKVRRLIFDFAVYIIFNLLFLTYCFPTYLF